MLRCSIFIPLLLLRFLPGVSPKCNTFTAEKCSETIPMMSWHNLLGEGIDITTLQWTRASLVDTSLWRGPNGTCTLCQNPLQEKQLYRVPLAVVDWKEHVICNKEIRSSVGQSAVVVAQAVASDVKNDWKKELGLTEDSKALALGGLRSKLPSFAYEKEQQDKYMFVLHKLSCVFYSSRLTEDPQLTSEFSQALNHLPPTYDRNRYRLFLGSYGTHYARQVDLGGLVRQLTAIPICRAVLDGLTDTEIKERLGSEFLQALGLSQLSSDSYAYEPSSQDRLSSQIRYMEKDIEVIGGNSHTKERFSTKQDITTFLAWLESLKASPGLVSYSLVPIHTLVEPGNPKREALRHAVLAYVADQKQRRMCPWPCPEGGYFDSLDPCKCHCSWNPLTDSMCCPLRRGLARLSVNVLWGRDLWGDPISATDAYVKVFFEGRELWTHHIDDDNNPEWNAKLDFGVVTVSMWLELEVEVWDSDSAPWVDNQLGRCTFYLKVTKMLTLTCNLDYGHVVFSYSLECGPNLGGDSCQEYVPVRG